MRQPIDNIGGNPLVYNPQTSVYISQKFGQHWYIQQDTYYYGKLYPKGTEFNSIFGLKGHNGVDYAAPTGTPYYATCDGWIIEQTKKETGYGYRLCILDKKNRVWVYGHSEEFETKVDGQVLEADWNFNNRSYPVREGEKLGYIDSTGFSSGPHLHLGLYEYDDKGNKLNSDNGYGGAIDPYEVITTKETMDNEFVKTINIKGTIGLVILADTIDNLKFLSKAYGKDITVNPDGTIPTDYSI